MEIKHTTRIWLAPLILGWLFDLLFFDHGTGINFPIFSVLVLAAGLGIAAGEGKRPPLSSLILLIPILFFAIMFAVRAEPFTMALNFLFTLGGMLIFAATLLGGQWWRYTTTDLIVNPIIAAFGAVIEPLRFVARKKDAPESSTDGESTAVPRKASPTGALLRGLALALPVVALLAALLASADPVFSDGLERFLAIFQIENLAEYVTRAILIAVVAFLLMGVFLYTLLHSQNEKVTGLEKPVIAPFLGVIEAGVVLTLVNLLFILFVAIQVRYFFGGAANIHLDGFTYAEYARRGFGELVAVAIVSLFLLQVLSAVVKRVERGAAAFFSAQGALLVLLVLVILVSAFQRLYLYETAYGFTQTRTYTHVFMIWLGLLLVTTFVLEVTRNTRAFAIATLLATIGFAVSVNIINVDAFVVRQNVARIDDFHTPPGSGRFVQELDSSYFLTLSTDATPPLVAAFQDARLPAAVRDQIGAVLVCKGYSEDGFTYRPDWRAWHFSKYRAALALIAVKPQLSDYRRTQTSDRYYETIITPRGSTFSCSPYTDYMD